MRRGLNRKQKNAGKQQDELIAAAFILGHELGHAVSEHVLREAELVLYIFFGGYGTCHFQVGKHGELVEGLSPAVEVIQLLLSLFCL